MTHLSYCVPLLLLYGVTIAQGTLAGGPCEGCEAVFEYGDRALTSMATLPDFDRPGASLGNELRYSRPARSSTR